MIPIMGIVRFVLELPTRLTVEEAVERAEGELSARGVIGWSELSLQTVLTSSSVGLSKFTFTYWISGGEAG